MTWEDTLLQDMQRAEQRTAQRAADIARAVAARDVKIAELWRRIDLIVDRVNDRTPAGARRFESVQSDDCTCKTISYGERKLIFQVEPLVFDTWRNEPAFYPGGLARVFVDPPARDLTELFCAVTDEGARWLVMPTCRLVNDEIVATVLRMLLA